MKIGFYPVFPPFWGKNMVFTPFYPFFPFFGGKRSQRFLPASPAGWRLQFFFVINEFLAAGLPEKSQQGFRNYHGAWQQGCWTKLQFLLIHCIVQNERIQIPDDIYF